jgi:hypothetical protein
MAGTIKKGSQASKMGKNLPEFLKPGTIKKSKDYADPKGKSIKKKIMPKGKPFKKSGRKIA